MNKIVRRQPRSVRSRLLLALCLGLLGTTFGAAINPAEAVSSSRLAVTAAVTAEAKLSSLTLQQLPASAALQEFTRQTLGKLAKNAPFTDWKNAKTEYFPLGPGTHGWLVNVLKGDQRVGYLIITAAEQGGLYLSEYGAGTDNLPYSLTELRRVLAQEALIPSDYSGKLELTALYVPLLPVWKMTLGQKTFYLSAAGEPELLPWDESKAQAVFKGQAAAPMSSPGPGAAFTPQKVYRSSGEDDPYADLRWLSAPRLDKLKAGSLSLLLAQGNALAFQSAGRNDLLGAPFMVTGYQCWNPAPAPAGTSGDLAPLIYAASGPEGRRFLPLALLEERGTLHALAAAKGSVAALPRN
ncbi:hypothetical protein [Paenibacillus tepidiphilus]|uniref:hypothetical protein n=1 Tax=Paenibacillus tepidiphilus TaxID=2608683 RepID=UPI00123AEFC3|nr:hypothetical protein [Paenibacillus tepidiphilus]